MPVIDREREFHDEWAKTIQIEDLKVKETFEAKTAIENHYILEKLGPLSGKKILDLGCGAGEASVYFAVKGAHVYACDVSEEFLKVAARLSEKNGVHINLEAADASHLPFENNFFDIVYGNGILHHAELSSAAKEIARILKKGGQAAFIEPLPYNPFIKIYRWLAKGVRTADEKPLTFKQIQILKNDFSSMVHQEFWLFSLLIFFHFFFVKRWNPSKVRYWKKVIEVADEYESFFSKLYKMDQFFLKHFPKLGFLCWNSVIILKK